MTDTARSGVSPSCARRRGHCGTERRAGFRRGLRIGLLGGSFDPPHTGHLRISRQALRQLGLHHVWWLVSPGNPLKDAPSAAFDTRLLAAAGAVAADPRIQVSALEWKFGTRYTVDTIGSLLHMRRKTRFVWLMGADNLATVHHWERWPQLFASVPVAVFGRPGWQLRAGLSVAARRFARARIPPSRAQALARRRPPAWCMLVGPLSSSSSTSLRQAARQ